MYVRDTFVGNRVWDSNRKSKGLVAHLRGTSHNEARSWQSHHPSSAISEITGQEEIVWR
jgi:hypothetical protein